MERNGELPPKPDRKRSGLVPLVLYLALVLGVGALILYAMFSNWGFPLGKGCPTPEEVRETIKGFAPPSLEVRRVRSHPALPQVCEVVLAQGAQVVVFYMDRSGRYILAGSLFDLKEKRDLTADVVREFQRLPTEVVAELEEHVDFAFGEKGSSKRIYFLTDPDCPFCKRSEPILESWAKRRGVEVGVVLIPLDIHPEADEKAASLICDRKGWEEYKKGYSPDNPCEEGTKKVRQNLAFAQRIGVNATPTFIGKNGRIVVGVPTEERLDQLIDE